MKKKIFLQAIGLIISMGFLMLSAQKAQAQEVGSLSYYNVPVSEYYDASTGQYKPEYYEWKEFLDYNLHQKPCGGYQQPPAGYYMKGCQVYHVEQTASVTDSAAQTSQAQVAPETAMPAAGPEKSYEPVTIYFDFDKSNIRNGENEKLDTVLDRIAADNPSQIVIAGHTDTAGPDKYNVWLSRRRAKVVADALMAKGIQKDIIEQKAYGETDLAVPTADNVPKQENRRTVVLFVQ